MESLYNKYEYIQLLLNKYRKYILYENEHFYDYDKFSQTLQVEQYIKHICVCPKKNCMIYIYIFNDNSKYLKITTHFKKLIDNLPNERASVMLFTSEPISVYLNKAILTYTHLNFHNYLHNWFSIELSKGPLCSPHTILSDDEVKRLCSRELIIHPLSLPAISINDPQNIWVGGELGQVIKIDSVSELTGEAVRYRIVSPDSGKLLYSQIDDTDKDTDDAV